jgi:rubredoxin
VTDYLTRCPKCKLVYRPELVVTPFSRDKPPDEYCPQCGANLDVVGEQTAENRRK